MYKKVLVATDFSHLSDEALPHATALASASGATLLIVHVQESPAAYGEGGMYYGVLEPGKEELQAMLEKVVPDDPDLRHEHHLLFGEPAAELTRFAEEQQVDVIVLATHGRTGLRRLLMGSIAEGVVRLAKCPVLTLKGTATSPQES